MLVNVVILSPSKPIFHAKISYPIFLFRVAPAFGSELQVAGSRGLLCCEDYLQGHHPHIYTRLQQPDGCREVAAQRNVVYLMTTHQVPRLLREVLLAPVKVPSSLTDIYLYHA